MQHIKENADMILYDLGLFDELKNYGVPHIVGSYTMDVMSAVLKQGIVTVDEFLTCYTK